jgi:hypothetical protein
VARWVRDSRASGGKAERKEEATPNRREVHLEEEFRGHKSDAPDEEILRGQRPAP